MSCGRPILGENDDKCTKALTKLLGEMLDDPDEDVENDDMRLRLRGRMMMVVAMAMAMAMTMECWRGRIKSGMIL